MAEVKASENTILMEDGSKFEYDIAIFNVGSKTKGTFDIPGILKPFTIATRPINDLLSKIVAKEQELKAAGTTPKLVVCGAGAAGVELAFGFKRRWNDFFGKEIDVTLVGTHGEVIGSDNKSFIK